MSTQHSTFPSCLKSAGLIINKSCVRWQDFKKHTYNTELQLSAASACVTYTPCHPSLYIDCFLCTKNRFVTLPVAHIRLMAWRLHQVPRSILSWCLGFSLSNSPEIHPVFSVLIEKEQAMSFFKVEWVKPSPYGRHRGGEWGGSWPLVSGHWSWWWMRLLGMANLLRPDPPPLFGIEDCSCQGQVVALLGLSHPSLSGSYS